jgi:hypothetical protein
MDFGSGWQYMGTASVRVHDIASIPADGLRYTAYLPTDLRNYRKKCEQAVVVKLREILSWETPPPVDPNWVPAWGGREDTTVLLSPLINKEDTDKLTPFITAAGRVSTDKINPIVMGPPRISLAATVYQKVPRVGRTSWPHCQPRPRK